LQIKGNLTSVGYSQLIANAPLLYLSVGSISTYNYELGFYSHKYDAVEGYNHTGVVRNHLDNSWYFFSNVRTEPDSTVDLGNANTVYDTVKLGNIIAYSGNTSTSTTTGAAVIYGGMGVGGNIYASAIQATPIGNGAASTGAFTTLTASGTITGAGQVVGYFNGAIGANTANSGAFTTVTASGNITAQTANVYAANVIGNTALYGGQFYWSNGATLASTITGQYGNSNVSAYLQNANVGNLATGNLIPLANTTYYLGNSTNYFANAYANNFNAITQLATPKIQFTVGGASILEDNPLDLAIVAPYQIAIKPAAYQYTFNNNGSLSGPGGTFVYANGAVYGNITATGAYWSNGVSFASTITGTYANSNVGSYLSTYSGNLSAGNITASGGGQIAGYITGAIGANVANSGAFTTITASGNITGANQVIGYLNGAIGANTANSGTFTTVVSSGNITAQTANIYAGNLNANTAIYSGQFYYTNGVSIASTIAAQSYGNTQAAAYLTVYNGNIAANTITAVQVGNTNTLHTGYLTTASQPNITAVGTLVNLTVTNTITGSVSGNAGTATALQTSRNINGVPFNGTSDITVTVDANNLTGTTLASGVTNSSLTSVGFLNNLSVNGNINTCNSVITNSVTAGVYTQNISTYDGVGNLNVYIPRNANLTVNAAQVAANLVVHGNSAAGWQNLLVTNGLTGQVGIKVGPNAITSGASLQVNSTDSIIIPAGTTGNRPTGAAGMIRYNTTTNQVEFYNAGTSQWTGTGSTFTTVTSNQFTGDGANVAFTLSQSATTNSTIVAINGVVQIPTTAYSVSGTTLTFTEAPLSTDIIDARVVVTTATVTALGQANSSINVSDTGGTTANISVIANNITRYVANVGTSGSNYFTGGQAPMMSNIALTQNTPTAIDTFSASAFRGAKYVIKVTDGTNGVYSMAEVIVVHNGTTPTSQIYGVVNTGANSLANFSTTLSAGSVNLLANTWSSTATATVFQTYMPV